MTDNFISSLEALLQPDREGGFSNNPADPGGMTNLGVTKRVWEAWVGRTVTEEDMRALTPATVSGLYKVKYWDAVSGDLLPKGVDYSVFDCAVNSGPGRAIRILQRVVGAVEDGVMGPRTLSAVVASAPATVITAYNFTRLEFMQSLPTWPTFKGGWGRRIVEVTAESASMVA